MGPSSTSARPPHPTTPPGRVESSSGLREPLPASCLLSHILHRPSREDPHTSIGTGPLPGPRVSPRSVRRRCLLVPPLSRARSARRASDTCREENNSSRASGRRAAWFGPTPRFRCEPTAARRLPPCGRCQRSGPSPRCRAHAGNRRADRERVPYRAIQPATDQGVPPSRRRITAGSRRKMPGARS